MKGGKLITFRQSLDRTSEKVIHQNRKNIFNFRTFNGAFEREIFRFFPRKRYSHRVAPKRRQRRAKKYQYQFQLRRNSIISAEGILAHFGCRPQRASTSISRLWKKLWVIDPSLSIGGSIGVLHRATGRFTSTRPDLRVAILGALEASAFTPRDI